MKTSSLLLALAGLSLTACKAHEHGLHAGRELVHIQLTSGVG
jgi:hypothetical protein